MSDKLKTKTLGGSFIFTIDSFRMTKHGGVKITLSVGEDQAPRALALALQTEAVFDGDFFLLENEVLGGKSAS